MIISDERLVADIRDHGCNCQQLRRYSRRSAACLTEFAVQLF